MLFLEGPIQLGLHQGRGIYILTLSIGSVDIVFYCTTDESEAEAMYEQAISMLEGELGYQELFDPRMN